MTLFEHLPPSADVWLYAASRPLTATEVSELRSRLDAFRTAWSTHGRQVESAVDVMDNRVLVLAADVPSGAMSGCGIDKSLHALQSYADDAGFEWVSGMTIVYRNAAGLLETVSRSSFAALVQAGQVSESTRVIDLSVRTLGDLLSSGVERFVRDSWHAKYLKADLPA